jgi:hypothetical protein
MIRAGQAVKISGVTLVPKWNWTQTYTAEVRQTLGRAGPATPRECREAFMMRAEKYARWIAERRGIELPDCATVELQGDCVAFFAEAIGFGRFFWERRPFRGSLIARIEIPNMRVEE